MSRAAKLKVYRTAIGFHDAYVAAPSKKAALQAWGSDKDLFARGAAELVTDEAFTTDALAAPGKVIKRLRATAEEQIAALPPDKPKRPAGEQEAKPPAMTSRSEQAQPKPKPKPRPSRAALDQAEQAVADAEEKHAQAAAELRRREEALARERRELMAQQADEMSALSKTRDGAQAAFDKAVAKWRDAAG